MQSRRACCQRFALRRQDLLGLLCSEEVLGRLDDSESLTDLANGHVFLFCLSLSLSSSSSSSSPSPSSSSYSSFSSSSASASSSSSAGIGDRAEVPLSVSRHFRITLGTRLWPVLRARIRILQVCLSSGVWEGLGEVPIGGMEEELESYGLVTGTGYDELLVWNEQTHARTGLRRSEEQIAAEKDRRSG